MGGSSFDTNYDNLPKYYQPISVGGDKEDEENASNQSNFDRNTDDEFDSHCIENGIWSLDLSNDKERKTNEAEEEEERMRKVSDSAILRALREDKRRLNASLAPEIATRVMEAMHGVSFSGLAPSWADQLLEDQWFNQLRRLTPPTTTNHD
ncbi:uncharacterized protein LOC114261816 [Camellia sinensis]|uniref:uncharacterized protein LOC114261816 n=1 Tax=Camellia sinensis TaxID=4442 RepID=UPI001035B792|nr:uncharacterized protein LOC114261816 [Camellia sinensis]